MSLGSVINFWFLTRGYGRLDLFPVGTPSVFPNADVVKERRPATGQGVQIGTRWPDDPRIVGRVVYRVRLPDGRGQLVCSGRVPCFPPPAPAGHYRFDVSFVDRWGGTSAPASGTYAVGHA